MPNDYDDPELAAIADYEAKGAKYERLMDEATDENGIVDLSYPGLDDAFEDEQDAETEYHAAAGDPDWRRRRDESTAAVFRECGFLPAAGIRPLVAPPRTAPRPRGAGRPRAQATRSSAASGDSGDSDSDEPARGGLPITIIRGDAAPGDVAVTRAFERILAAQRPGATWSVTP